MQISQYGTQQAQIKNNHMWNTNNHKIKEQAKNNNKDNNIHIVVSSTKGWSKSFNNGCNNLGI